MACRDENRTQNFKRDEISIFEIDNHMLLTKPLEDNTKLQAMNFVQQTQT